MIIHQELARVQASVFAPFGLSVDKLQQQKESEEYGAYAFVLAGKNILFRVAKITPKKIGQFVTLWKREGRGPIMPFDMSDLIDLVVIAVRCDTQSGLFVFSQNVLLKQDIFSRDAEGGKRALRVYPPWDHVASTQAKKTQRWQNEYFLDTSGKAPLDALRVKQLFLW